MHWAAIPCWIMFWIGIAVGALLALLACTSRE